MGFILYIQVIDNYQEFFNSKSSILGKLEKDAILKAIYPAFEEITEPVVCLSNDNYLYSLGSNKYSFLGSLVISKQNNYS